MKAYIISLLAVILKFSAAQTSLELTSEPSSSSGPFCPGHVQFTCTGTELPVVLRWVLNGSIIAMFSFSSSQTYPLSLDPEPPTTSFPPGVMINVTSAVESPNIVNSINITAILDVSDVSVLNRLSLYCEDSADLARSDVINIEVGRGLAPPPQPKCILQSVSGGLEMVFQWSDEFNAEHVVERYNVRVRPDPASCTSDQVPPHQNYSCSGLDRTGTNYSVSITAFNCIDQEGGDATYTIQPQLLVPGSPQNVATVLESEAFTVSWMESAATSGRCSFSGAVNYTVTLEDIDGTTVGEKSVGSDSCDNGTCSIGFPPSSLICDVNIVAANQFGSSDIATARIVPPRLTAANQVLLALGVVLLCVAIIAEIVVVVTVKARLILLLLVCEIVLTVVASMLWVAVGFQVGLQDDTCNASWQKSRDGLIISSFVVSLITVGSITVIVIASRMKSGVKKKVPTLTDQKETWEKVKVELKATAGGRIEALESGEVLVDEHIHKGESNRDAYLRISEEMHHKYSAEMQDDPTHYDVTKHPVPPRDSTYSPLRSGKESEEYSSLLYSTGKGRGNPISTKIAACGRLTTEMHFRQPGETQLEARFRVMEEEYVKGGSEYSNPELRPQGDSCEEENKVDTGLLHDKGREGSLAEYTILSEPPCIAMWKLNTYLSKNPELTLEEAQDLQALMADWFPDQRKWSKEDLSEGKPLKVHFMNSCPRRWRYIGGKITPELIMQFLSDTWKGCFTIGCQDDSHIRVLFQDDAGVFGNWSVIGSMAKVIDKSKPTMLLNFGCMSGEEIKGTVVHQFGHALGLGHALMRPEDWEVLKEYLDLHQILSFYFSPSIDKFEVQWTGKGRDPESVNYDERSVMAYSANLLWLKDGTLRTYEGVQSAEISDEVKKCLLKFIKHSQLRSELSAVDARTILGGIPLPN